MAHCYPCNRQWRKFYRIPCLHDKASRKQVPPVFLSARARGAGGFFFLFFFFLVDSRAAVKRNDTVMQSVARLTHRYFRAAGRAERCETFEMLKTRLHLTRRHILAGLIDRGSLSSNTVTRYTVMA